MDNNGGNHLVDTYSIGPLVISNEPERSNAINKLLNNLIFDQQIIQRIRNVFISEMELALNEQQSSLQMENTYIPELPDGTEEGIYLALDLGGTNFRVILMEIKGSNTIREDVKHYQIPESMRIGCGDRLFLFLAECVDDFVRMEGLEDVTLPLGFTFSFPMQQHSLDSGVLVTWTKSFNCPSVVGKDAVKLLRDSLKRIGRNNIEVLAILNDTTGTLVQGARLDRNTRVGIVLGTGTNGAYMERADRVHHWETVRHGETHVLIDIEWGAFGDNGVLDFIKTEFDRAVDNASLLKNSFTFEKYIGGKYLGELCRVIFNKMIEKNLLFTRKYVEFPGPWEFGSDNVSKIEMESIDGTSRTEEILQNLGYVRNSDYDDIDIEIIRHVCGLVSKRAAQLLAITTSTIVDRMDEEEVTVAIDGSVYKHHPRLKYWLETYTNAWAPTKRSKFILAEDGSGKGAALIAAIAKRINERTID